MQSKVIGIASALPQNGAKYTAINLAYFLKKHDKEEHVLVLDFDFEFPMVNYEELRNVELNIDKLASSSVVLDERVLENYVVKTQSGVDMLKGSYLHSPEFFTETLLSSLINTAKEKYDYIIVVFNLCRMNAGSIVSLLNANKTVLVVKNNASNELMIQRSFSHLRMYYPENLAVDVVYNQKNHHAKSNVLEKVKGDDMNIVGVLEYVPHTIDNLNLQSKSFFKKKSPNDRFFKKWVKAIKKELKA